MWAAFSAVNGQLKINYEPRIGKASRLCGEIKLKQKNSNNRKINDPIKYRYLGVFSNKYYLYTYALVVNWRKPIKICRSIHCWIACIVVMIVAARPTTSKRETDKKQPKLKCITPIYGRSTRAQTSAMHWPNDKVCSGFQTNRLELIRFAKIAIISVNYD